MQDAPLNIFSTLDRRVVIMAEFDFCQNQCQTGKAEIA